LLRQFAIARVRQRRNHIKLAKHYEIPRTSEGQKKNVKALIY